MRNVTSWWGAVLPLGINHYASIEVHPLLDANRIFFKSALQSPLDADQPLAAYSNTLRCNAFRSILLLQRELLEQGEALAYLHSHGEGNIQRMQELHQRFRLFSEMLPAFPTLPRGPPRVPAPGHSGRNRPRLPQRRGGSSPSWT